MKTKIELEQNIITISSKIREEFPELSKYIVEMPENNSVNEAINIKNLDDYYHSLEDLLREYSETHSSAFMKKNSETRVYSDLQKYPPSEDIYQHYKETDLNPEDISKMKILNEKEGSRNEMDFEDDMSGGDLDVPGSELDDQQEDVGSEDEENNYYSIGGDNHNDLEEDKAQL